MGPIVTIQNDMTRNATRMHGGAYAICAIATLGLLANHPGGGALTFADMLKGEARDQFMDGIVHGGFIMTLSTLIVCFVYLARHLGNSRLPVVIGFVAFCIGAGAIMASMIVDGFATPAVAARFANDTSPDKLAMARSILIVFATLIRFLMPMGLLFQAIAILGWSTEIVRRPGFGRVSGGLGIIVGALVIAGLAAVPAGMIDHVLLVAIVLQGVWYLSVTLYLFTTKEVT